MAGFRRFRKYKKFTKKSGFLKKQMTRTAQKAILKDKEEKMIWGSIVASNAVFGALPSNAWQDFSPMSLCAQGDTTGSRDASQIYLKSFHLDGIFTSGAFDQAGDAMSINFRIVLATWSGFGTSTPMTSMSPAYSFDIPLMKQLIPTGSGSPRLIKVYHDKMYSIVNTYGSLYYLPSHKKHIKIHKTFKKPITLTYNATAATNPDQILVLSVIAVYPLGGTHLGGFENGSIICKYVEK